MKRAVTLALALLGFLYGAAMKARAVMYQRGIFRTHTIAAPVISVGNLTTGGTGKTPLVEWIARELAQQGRRVCILTRGYGRANAKRRLIASDGIRILSNAAQSGDEALMLAEELAGKAAVICDADRVSSARWAIENFKAEVFILDDAFQNLRIARNLNIVTVDAKSPMDNGHVLPAGLLREPITALGRADCIVLTRADESIAADLLSRIREASDAIVLTSRMVTSQIRSINSSAAVDQTESDFSKPIAAFCGIGNSAAFFDHVRCENFELVHTAAFRDHHKYTQSEIDRITKDAVAHGAHALFTTAKDEVKLRAMRFDLPCYVVNIAIEIAEREKLVDLIEASIRPGQTF